MKKPIKPLRTLTSADASAAATPRRARPQPARLTRQPNPAPKARDERGLGPHHGVGWIA